MLKELDRDRFLENLQACMSWHLYSATELENEIGVYSGYISRLKSDSQKLPALDIAFKMAQVLGVNLEWLIEGGATNQNEDSATLYEFLERLFELTRRREMCWTRHAYGEVNEWIMKHRLPEELCFLAAGLAEEEGSIRVHSMTQPEYQARLAGDVWSAPFLEHTVLWFIPMKGTLDLGDEEDYCEWFEMLLQDQQKLKEPSLLCGSGMPGGECFDPELRKLQSEIVARSGDLILDPDIKIMLDAFMRKTQSAGRKIEGGKTHEE